MPSARNDDVTVNHAPTSTLSSSGSAVCGPGAPRSNSALVDAFAAGANTSNGKMSASTRTATRDGLDDNDKNPPIGGRSGSQRQLNARAGAGSRSLESGLSGSDAIPCESGGAWPIGQTAASATGSEATYTTSALPTTRLWWRGRAEDGGAWSPARRFEMKR